VRSHAAGSAEDKLTVRTHAEAVSVNDDRQTTPTGRTHLDVRRGVEGVLELKSVISLVHL